MKDPILWFCGILPPSLTEWWQPVVHRGKRILPRAQLSQFDSQMSDDSLSSQKFWDTQAIKDAHICPRNHFGALHKLGCPICLGSSSSVEDSFALSEWCLFQLKDLQLITLIYILHSCQVWWCPSDWCSRSAWLESTQWNHFKCWGKYHSSVKMQTN